MSNMGRMDRIMKSKWAKLNKNNTKIMMVGRNKNINLLGFKMRGVQIKEFIIS